MSKDPNSYIQASAETLAETLLFKNSDYAPAGEFSNFEKAAEVAKVSVQQVMLTQIAIKLTRIERLQVAQTERYGGPLNESLKDSFLDLAGYAIIAHAYLEYVGSPDAMDAYQEASNAIREVDEEDLHPYLQMAIKERCVHSWDRVNVETYECSHCGKRETAEQLLK